MHPHYNSMVFADENIDRYPVLANIGFLLVISDNGIILRLGCIPKSKI